jgi:hypothetical protein
MSTFNLSQTNLTQTNTNLTQTNTILADQIIDYLNMLDQYPDSLINEELSKFDQYIQTDASSKPAYVSSDLVIIKTYGNGLCWNNSILTSVFGKFWQNTTELDIWIQSLIATFGLDPTFVPIRNLYLYGIEIKISSDGIEDYDIVHFLNSNKYLMHILSLNILKFAIQNYSNPVLNIVPKLLPLETGIAYNSSKQKFYAIDGQLRNFIMSIMGIDRVVVFQNKTEAKHRRYTNLDLNLLAIDYEGEYAGFEIEAFNNINCMGILGSVLLLTHNSEHYDAFFDNETFKTTLALKDQMEILPEFVKID